MLVAQPFGSGNDLNAVVYMGLHHCILSIIQFGGLQQDLITDATAKLGISTGQAESAARGLLGFIKEQADGADFGELLGKLPGAGELLAKAEGREAGGGLLGGLGDAVGDLLGGGAEQALGMAGLVGKLGLDADKLGGFLELFTKYVQPLLGTDLLKRLAAKIPGLGDLIS